MPLDDPTLRYATTRVMGMTSVATQAEVRLGGVAHSLRPGETFTPTNRFRFF